MWTGSGVMYGLKRLMRGARTTFTRLPVVDVKNPVSFFSDRAGSPSPLILTLVPVAEQTGHARMIEILHEPLASSQHCD